MKTYRYPRTAATLLVCALVMASSLLAAGGSPKGTGSRKESAKDSTKDSTTTSVVNLADADAMRLQGEQRFHANCGRCHATPQKFPPRMMATVLRHMRVRATITDADMRLILSYMTQ